MAVPTTPTTAEAQAFVDAFNADYEVKHEAFEKQFWGTKMALSDNAANGIVYSAENLSKTKQEMENLLADPQVRIKAEYFLKQLLESSSSSGGAAVDGDAESDLVKTLRTIVRTCNCYDMSSAPQAKKIREKTSELESDLEMARNRMKLGYTVPSTGEFKEASSVGLRNLLRTADDEAVRKAAYEGLRSIGPFVLEHNFVEIIKLRNQVARALGFIDYYDYKVTNAEGFGKIKLFEILDGLEKGTRPIMESALKELAARHGEEALKPWNASYKMAGSIITKMDPYFPFSKAVERYVKSYDAMKIDYQKSTMNLDLLDRKNKYSNGFCHWPLVAWIKPDGTWQPSTANFTSLADPTAVGSGLTALQTLMHEAGHAAHMANIKQPCPLNAQERAPTSVAYAENQSMFLDSLVSDAAWRAKYALDANDKPIPFEIIEEEIRAIHPFAVFQLRAMLSVSYFEKALYELPEEEVTSENIQKLADKTELEYQGVFSGRPLLSIPHLVSDEASCYYHGYTLAEMSVYQTRAFFKDTYGYIVDNPQVGPLLTKSYWEPGNSRPFLSLVKDLTGKELTGDAWVAALKKSVDQKIAEEKKEYDEMLEKVAKERAAATPAPPVDLNMNLVFVDGDEVIANSSELGILGACKKFETFVAARVAAAK